MRHNVGFIWQAILSHHTRRHWALTQTYRTDRNSTLGMGTCRNEEPGNMEPFVMTLSKKC